MRVHDLACYSAKQCTKAEGVNCFEDLRMAAKSAKISPYRTVTMPSLRVASFGDVKPWLCTQGYSAIVALKLAVQHYYA